MGLMMIHTSNQVGLFLHQGWDAAGEAGGGVDVLIGASRLVSFQRAKNLHLIPHIGTLSPIHNIFFIIDEGGRDDLALERCEH